MTDRYTADDGINAVEVEYEPLPPLIDPFKAMDADAPLLREDIKDKKDGAHGARKHYNHIFEWTVGDKDLTDAAFNKAEVSIKEMISYHRVHPSPLETCQCICSFDKVKGELTIYGTCLERRGGIARGVEVVRPSSGASSPESFATKANSIVVLLLLVPNIIEHFKSGNWPEFETEAMHRVLNQIAKRRPVVRTAAMAETSRPLIPGGANLLRRQTDLVRLGYSTTVAQS